MTFNFFLLGLRGLSSRASPAASSCHLGQHRSRTFPTTGSCPVSKQSGFVKGERNGSCIIQINQLHFNNRTFSQLWVRAKLDCVFMQKWLLKLDEMGVQDKWKRQRNDFLMPPSKRHKLRVDGINGRRQTHQSAELF